VPAEPKEWTYDPFAGEIADGALWGRGAVDMLDMDAMTLASSGTGCAAVASRRATWCWPSSPTRRPAASSGAVAGRAPAGPVRGLHEAISEVGGFSLSVNDDLRLYLIETARRAWPGCG
jgi:hypothetical protein